MRLRATCALALAAITLAAAPLHAAQTAPHGTIKGKLFGADGAPLSSAWVSAIPATGEIPIDNVEQLTGDDGSFSLDVDPGKYFVVANFDWPATQSVPVLTTYYPSAETESAATAVTVTAGQTAASIDIHVKRVLTPKYIDVTVQGPDGNPAPKADAYLTQVNQASVAGNDSGTTYVDKSAKAHLLYFDGVDYLLFAEQGVGAAKICSPVMKLPHTTPVTAPITLKLTLAQPACHAQEDDARKAAYAMQSR